jgi:stage III sporulation protein AG
VQGGFGLNGGKAMYSDGVSPVKGTVGQLKRSGKLWIVILGALIGLGLLVLGSLELPIFEKKEQGNSTELGAQSELQSYREQLSNEIALLCTQVRGVGKVRVVVTLSGGYEYVYACDVQSKTDEDSSTWEESYVLVGSGSSQAPLLLMRRQPGIAGVGIVCEGGADPYVQNELTALISAAFGIGTNKIHVSASQNQ